jgi:signal transduction histidine kinase
MIVQPASNPSIRRRLLTGLLPLYVLVAVVAGAASYWGYGRLVRTFLDDQLQVLAESYIGQRDTTVLRPVSDRRVNVWGAPVVQLWTSDGRLLATSLPGTDIRLQAAQGLGKLVDAQGQQWRVYRTHGEALDIQVAQSEKFRNHQATGLALYIGLPIAALLLLTLLIAWRVISTSSRSLHGVARIASEQNETNITSLPVAEVPEEIRPLVMSFNALLEKLRAAFAVQRRFVQDAAHELRTPLTAIELQLENLRAHIPDGDPAERLQHLDSGLRRMRRLVEQLLRLVRHDAAPAIAARTEIRLEELLRDCLGEMMVLADQKDVEVGFEGDGTYSFLADAGDLRSIFENLIENALRYSPAGSGLDVRMYPLNGRMVVDVVDCGPGIPSEYLGRVFERFFRVAGEYTVGSGLGLPIALAAARRNGMSVELINRQGISGLIARVHLQHAT